MAKITGPCVILTLSMLNNCAIVIDGRINRRLSDLKPNDKLVFSYDEINGVNVASRIALVGRVQAPATPSGGQ